MKIIFTPHEDIFKIPEKDRLKWAEALETSNQHKNAMSNSDDTAHCCLCVAERVLNGATFETYKDRILPSWNHGYRLIDNDLDDDFLHELIAAEVNYSDGKKQLLSFSCLNDYHLTHKQISQLLKGKTVEVKKK